MKYLALLAGLALFIPPAALGQTADGRMGVGQASAARGPLNARSWPGDLHRARDTNPSPDIVEVTLRAGVFEQQLTRGAVKTTVWGYNGVTPGPMIEAEVGNTLIVHFYNDLPVPTTIHWHGVELPASMDGTQLSQVSVPPGGTFRYEFRLTRAALYWYHPHFSTHEQIEKGLYGALLVRDPAADAELELPTQERVLMLDDVLLDAHNQIAPPFSSDPLERALAQLNGREGNLFLTNGHRRPRLHVRAEPIRLRVVNAANSRFMRISIDGHRMWRIGGDGGLLEEPIEILPVNTSGVDLDPTHGLILTPGERADLVFTPTRTGDIPLRWSDWTRGRHSTFYKPDGTIGVGDARNDGRRRSRVLAFFRVRGSAPDHEYLPPPTLRDIEPLDVTGARALMAMLGHSPPNADGDVTFFVQMKDGAPLPFPMVTPEDAPKVEVNETVTWDVVNMTGGEHNFHLHGFMFQPLQVTYIDMDTPENNRVEPFPYLEEKDTVRLLARPGAPMRSRTVTRLAVRFDDTGREGEIAASGGAASAGSGSSGGWMFHCHINEHSARGMMSYIQVFDDLPSVAQAGRGSGAAFVAAPDEVSLEQNAPNPFADRTALRFFLPEAATASLRVYDLLGREVATLVDGPQGPGLHEVQWDAHGLSNGVYVYRLTTGSFSEAKQLVLQR